MSVIDRFTTLYSHFDKAALVELPHVYAEEIVFVDPVSEHKGLEAVSAYFAGLVENTEKCQCDIIDKWQHGDTVFLTWNMQYAHPSLKSGASVEVQGLTQLTIEQDKVIYHRDYYDMGQMVYEHVPLLGALVRGIKKRMCQ